MGRDFARAQENGQRRVSIHAPTWGATHLPHDAGDCGGVSIHAPTWGATTTPTAQRWTSNVSIHAPTWGATRTYDGMSMVIHGFNPRAHVGRDLSLAWLRTPPRSFNPRAHVGRDFGLLLFEALAKRFNPRAHVGRDNIIRICINCNTVSIHAPTWGATDVDRHTVARYVRFNPRAHVGRDLQQRLSARLQDVSIHAPTWGATAHVLGDHPGLNVSIHAPTWGATRCTCACRSVSPCFNPRAHVGRD